MTNPESHAQRKYSLFIVRLILFILLCSFITPSLSLAWSGKLTNVADGDTITVLHDGQEKKIRFYGIDCPEGDQNFGQQAKAFTSAMVHGRKIQIKPMDTDRYGRTVALVFADEINVNEQIVSQGYGWVYRQYCKDGFCNDWLRQESTARDNHKGLWSESSPQPPWEYRQQQRAAGGRHSLGMQPTNTQTVLAGSAEYHGNRNSHAFHAPGCRDYNCKNCTVNFPSVQAAIAAGYHPHRDCVH